METEFSTISNIIKSRRSIKPAMMNGHKIPNGHVAAMLELADWAPTHGLTEPWRFVVYENPADFCHQHAAMYKEHTPAENFNENTYNNLMNMGNKVSHVVAAIMKRSPLGKIPGFEEYAATACSIENLLIGATALNIASFWSTGGMALKPAMKDFFELGEEDHVLGIIYLGYVDEQPQGIRRVPLEEKVKWVNNAG